MLECAAVQPAFARRVVEHRLTLVAGLAAALPVIVSTVRAVANGWVPLGDDAVIATRSLDVLSLHPPLLGQYSASSALLGEPANSLGPMLYWLLAIPAHIGPAAITIVMGLANAAAVIGCVALARRRGGLVLMYATAAAIALVCGALPFETLHSIWNPSAALLPFTLLVFVAWSVASGEHRLLPLAVVLASFVVQGHLTYVAPVLGLLAIAVAGLVLARRRAEGSIRRWLLAALATGLVCWSFPLVEQAIHRPGNFVTVAKAATAGGPKLGAQAGWNALTRAAGVPPWWLESPAGGIDTFGDVTNEPSGLSQASAALVLAALLVALAVALRRRRTDVAVALAVALVLVLSLAAVAASTPTTGILFISIGYTLRWGAVAGMWAWVALAWSAWTLLRPQRIRAGHARAAQIAGVAAALAAGVLVAVRGDADRLVSAYDPVAAMTDKLEAALPRDRPVRIESAKGSSGFDFRFDVEAALVYDLRRRGTRVYTQDLALGALYAEAAPAEAQLVRVGGGASEPGATLVDRIQVTETDYDPGDRRAPLSKPVTVLLLQTGR